MTSTAQKRANSKYQKEKVRQQLVKFYPNDADIFDHLSIQSNKMGYIKDLIRRDMQEAVDHSSHAIIWEEGGTQFFDTYEQWREAIAGLTAEEYPVEVWGNICTVDADYADYLEEQE